MTESIRQKDPGTQPIRLCLLWHQHQPYYRLGDRFVMPWVWLHATKDYLEMAQHLERHPGVKATINLVPSLLKQLDEYLSGEVRDSVIDLMATPTGELTDLDRQVILDNFFLANPSTVIERSSRYKELYEWWTSGATDFREQDYRDIAIHYSLAWTGEFNRRVDPWKRLVEKDRDFTEEDRAVLMSAQRAAVKEVVEVHKRLAKRGQVELTTTPFYHPILPLVIDTTVAREAIRDVSLPLEQFSRPEDATLQLQRSIQMYRAKFGSAPKGLWPSEGSLSDATLRLIAESGITWTATDEGVLDRTLGHHPKVDHPLVHAGLGKFLPWSYSTPSGPITLFFRDHRLSDAIGFSYQSWDPKAAVGDLLHHIDRIRDRILEVAPETLPDACVTIILDGENCWEYYPNNGYEFLDTLYSELEESRTIETCTFHDVASARTDRPALEHITAGSWINSNFRIWIGHPEDNAAWDALAEARRALERFEEHSQHVPSAFRPALRERLEQAREHILIAEGSDWCWWYGDDHYSAQRDLFDGIFRQHLRAAYVLMDSPVPEDLLVPIIDRADLAARYHRPSQQESRPQEVPHIAGKLLNDSWIGIPNCAPPKVFGAMHRSFDREIEDLRLAGVGNEVLLRLIVSPAVPEQSTVLIHFEDPRGLLVRFTNDAVELQSTDGLTTLTGFFDETLECSIPKPMLGGTNRLRFKLEVTEADGRVTSVPETGTIECTITDVEL